MLASTYIKNNQLAILSPNCLGLIDKLAVDSRLTDTESSAYVLATIKHETAGTYRPIKEFGLGKGHSYGAIDLANGQAYYGRGYVQLTWKSNYEKFGKLLNIDLVNNPDLALTPDTAYDIIVIGMTQGLFTGKKLSDYITANSVDFVDCRRIINGMDKAQLIAGYATDFNNLLNKVFPNI